MERAAPRPAALAFAAELCPAAQAADLRGLMLPYTLDGSWRVSCDREGRPARARLWTRHAVTWGGGIDTVRV